MKIDLDNVWGNPKYHRNIPIYPVQMENIEDLYDTVQCLLLPKNTIQNPMIIKMSYLAFLILISSDDVNKHFFDKLVTLIKLISRSENIRFDVDEKNRYTIIIDDEIVIRERDFDKIKVIIGEQNLIDVSDESLGTEFDKAKSEARAFMNKRNKKMADLEQQIIAYKCVSKSSYEDIKQMTIYQFRKELERYDLIKSADILQNAQYSGMVSFKEGTVIPHWLDHIETKNPDDDIVMSKEQLDKLVSDKGISSN
ncbi:hypothetical protein FJQ98_16705 [Lysinibacillus agricola]|uniref:Phage protein n=1 Tax=Lysinibacillus agricola TaxID=2590012 RepID=A0ABX7AN10_9BACI|nr:MULTISPECIES: hypothetical protein [Lysinibacillus]KOS61434.1 hypothetical protein AN161_17725 [Lysinibacillus sp. FJAT-14222]QQP10886.1 hypothetical protein FJQ98_16705 [Lysinibacillus agricola]